MTYTILYFLSDTRGFGGAANTLIQQAILMKQSGSRIAIFFPDYKGEKVDDMFINICSDAGIAYERMEYQSSSQPEDIDIVCMDRNYEKLRDKIKKYQADILHSVQINPCVELISRELGIPHVMNIYPLIPDFFSINYINIFPHYHICDSMYYADKWKAYLHTDSVCIRTVVNKQWEEKEKTIGKETINYICVGTVYKGKNQLAVIKAFHKALENGLNGILHICGYSGGDYMNECIRYIESHQLQKSIVIKGFCKDMNREYAQNDVLICGSTRESYPNAVSEAMARGLIILSTPVGGVPEVIKDGENGYLTRDYTEDALTEKILQVQKDINSERIKTIAANARETFINNHSPEKVKQALINYYQYVMEDYQKANFGKKQAFDIQDIRLIFGDWIKYYNANLNKFTDRYAVSIKLWYLYYIKDSIEKAYLDGKEVYVWGTGKYGVIVREIMEAFMSQINISGYLDSRKTGKFGKYRIIMPDEILGKDNCVVLIAAVNGQTEMVEKLEENNKHFNKDYFILAERVW